jgi:hypothetical protein
VSQSFTVVPATQAIAFATPVEQAVGVTSILAATASSGLAVTFTSLTIATCTVGGTMLTPLAVGTCTIQASQAGNANYGPAVPIDRSFNVVNRHSVCSTGDLRRRVMALELCRRRLSMVTASRISRSPTKTIPPFRFFSAMAMVLSWVAETHTTYGGFPRPWSLPI